MLDREDPGIKLGLRVVAGGSGLVGHRETGRRWFDPDQASLFLMAGCWDIRSLHKALSDLLRISSISRCA
jgi:hypothetical protein